MLTLNAEQLHELTGCRQAPAQIAWLRRYGWRFAVTAQGKPRVARAYFDKRMAGIDSTPEPPNEPDFAAIDGAA